MPRRDYSVRTDGGAVGINITTVETRLQDPFTFVPGATGLVTLRFLVLFIAKAMTTWLRLDTVDKKLHVRAQGDTARMEPRHNGFCCRQSSHIRGPSGPDLR